MPKLYEEREIDELDTYIDHVSAMTTEGLHSKSAIAAELAFRDEEINKLKRKMSDNTEKCKLYRVTLSDKRERI